MGLTRGNWRGPQNGWHYRDAAFRRSLTYREFRAGKVSLGLGGVPKDAPNVQGRTGTSICEEDLDAVARPFGLGGERIRRAQGRAPLRTDLEKKDTCAGTGLWVGGSSRWGLE